MNGYSILLIDDDETTHEVLGSYLDIAGFHVRSAYNRAEGLARLKEEAPDLVVLDVQMPELDGFQTMEQIRRDQRLADLPVLFLTSLDRSNLKIKGLELGADDYIVKPLVKAEILARVKAALRRTARYRNASSSLNGDLAAVSVTELLQTMELGRRSCSISLPDLGGGVYIENGSLVHVAWGDFTGAAALQRILLLERGKFTLVLGEIPPEVPREAMSANHLILDSLTHLDELCAILGPWADPACLVEEIDPSLEWVPTRLLAKLPLACRDFIALLPGDMKARAEIFVKEAAAGRIVIGQGGDLPAAPRTAAL